MQRQLRAVAGAPKWPHGQGRVALLPFVPLRLVARRYPEPQCLGDHLRAARRQRRLRQLDVTAALGVSVETVANWEKAKTEPPVTLIPAIIQFLGYDPFPAPATLGEHLRHYRKRHGLSIKAAAERLGVDEGSWSLWEKTGRVTQRRHRARLAELLREAGAAH